MRGILGVLAAVGVASGLTGLLMIPMTIFLVSTAGRSMFVEWGPPAATIVGLSLVTGTLGFFAFRGASEGRAGFLALGSGRGGESVTEAVAFLWTGLAVALSLLVTQDRLLTGMDAMEVWGAVVTGAAVLSIVGPMTTRAVSRFFGVLAAYQLPWLAPLTAAIYFNQGGPADVTPVIACGVTAMFGAMASLVAYGELQ